jgi:exosortase
MKPRIFLFFSLLLLFVSFAYLYRDTIANLVKIWMEDGNYSHGFLVPLAVGYFIYLRRGELRSIPAKPYWPAAILVVLAGLLLLAGQLAIHQFSQHASVFLMVFALTLFVFGKDWFKVLALPLLFLAFMFPLPEFFRRTVTGPLQLLSSYISVGFLHLMNYPIYREGNILYIADTTLSVAEACSGLRSIVALMFASSVIGYVTFTNKWKTVIPFLCAFPVAVLLNWTRISSTVVIADYWGADLALKFFHDFSGLVVTLVAIVIITALIVLFKKRELKSFGKVKEEASPKQHGWILRPAGMIAASVIIFGSAAYADLLFSFKPPPVDIFALPLDLGPYKGTEQRIDPEITEFSSVTQDRDIVYSDSLNPPIDLYLGHYRMGRNLTGLFHGSDVCLPGSGYQIIEKLVVPFKYSFIEFKALMYLSQKDGQRNLMVTWIQNGSELETNYYRMIGSIFWKAAVKFRYDDSTKIMVSTFLKKDESKESGMKRIEKFIEHFQLNFYNPTRQVGTSKD